MRRSALALVSAAFLTGPVALDAEVSPPPPPAPVFRELTLTSTHTGDTLTARYFVDGKYDETAIAGLEYLLRDHRTGESHPIDRPLFDILCDVAREAGVAANYEVISGYRSPATNEMLRKRNASSGVSNHSLHMQGKAIDVRLRGVATSTVRDIALRLARGGVGYYARSDFVHLDTGRVRRWSG
jgi:uncharacterized protein YcbK (DUF882 family)